MPLSAKFLAAMEVARECLNDNIEDEEHTDAGCGMLHSIAGSVRANRNKIVLGLTQTGKRYTEDEIYYLYAHVVEFFMQGLYPDFVYISECMNRPATGLAKQLHKQLVKSGIDKNYLMITWKLSEVDALRLLAPDQGQGNLADFISEKKMCQGVTLKKKQCAFRIVPGQCFCKHHMKKKSDVASSNPVEV